jgi:glycosyltransferase involved in cell wall biosynthesis
MHGMAVGTRMLAPASQSAAPAAHQSLERKFEHSVSLLAWAYNEQTLVESFLDRATTLLDQTTVDWEIVLINDGSTDRTGELLAAYAQREPRLRVIDNEVNRNVGYCCKRAIGSATKDFLFWQTVDWSYDISHLRALLELTRHFDVVQGIRPTPIRLVSYIPLVRSIYRVKTRSDNWRKAVVSLANYYLLRILFGVPFHDFQNITIYPTKMVQGCELTGNSAFVNPECLIRTYSKGARFIEVPIPFISRSEGIAKGTRFGTIVRAVTDILVNWFRWGIALRISRRRSQLAPIRRVAEPFQLSEEVAALVVPLLKYFR